MWFTGLSGSGKSTVACTVEHELARRGSLTALLDGDNVRHGLNKARVYVPTSGSAPNAGVRFAASLHPMDAAYRGFKSSVALRYQSKNVPYVWRVSPATCAYAHRAGRHWGSRSAEAWAAGLLLTPVGGPAD